MKWHHGALTDQLARTTFFKVPDLGVKNSQGTNGFEQFDLHRRLIRATGGDLLLIGWPDGTTITYHQLDVSNRIDLDTLVATYRASAAMHRVMNAK